MIVPQINILYYGRQFYSGSFDLIRIQGNGNVDHGISNPQYKLDINEIYLRTTMYALLAACMLY